MVRIGIFRCNFFVFFFHFWKIKFVSGIYGDKLWSIFLWKIYIADEWINQTRLHIEKFFSRFCSEQKVLVNAQNQTTFINSLETDYTQHIFSLTWPIRVYHIIQFNNNNNNNRVATASFIYKNQNKKKK